MAKTSLKKAEKIKALIDELPGEDSERKWEVMDELTKFGKEAVPFLMDALLSHDGSKMFCGTTVLARIGTDALPALPILVALLKHFEPDMRYQAAYALGQIGEDAIDAVAPLIDTLTDEDREVRIQAASSLADIGLNRILCSTRNDPDLEVREQLNILLGR